LSLLLPLPPTPTLFPYTTLFRSPPLELQHALGRLLSMQLRHPPVVQHLAAAHRVAEVDLPGVLRPHVAERRGDAAFGHDGVRLAQERLADETDRDALRRGLDRGPESRATGADHDD